VISYHYCMEEFDSVKLGDKKSDTCGKCGMHTGKMGCCNDEVRIFKIQDDQQTAAIHYKFTGPEPIIEPFPARTETPVNSVHEIFVTDHSPPLSKQDTYLQNCVFRI